MDSSFLMGNRDGISRSMARSLAPTYVTPELRERLTLAAMDEAFDFCADFLGMERSLFCSGDLYREYGEAVKDATSLGLFQRGGIKEKDHLGLWCLTRSLAPDIYLESGVFQGSSLHAACSFPGLRRIIAIDPDLTQLKLPRDRIPHAEFVGDKDFSQLELSVAHQKSLAYFDDHINTAQRILQAHEKGFRHILFDDSTGMEGVCQRAYPAVPTLPMILHADLLKRGDTIAWSHTVPHDRSLLERISGIRKERSTTRLTLQITDDFLELCRAARDKIKQVGKLPDLGTFIPQQDPEPMIDTTKYLVELHVAT